MASGAYELRGADSINPVNDNVTALRWPLSPGTTDTVEAGLGWNLDPLAVTNPARDLVRVAGAAYLADSLTKRGSTFTRDISLTVAVAEPDLWTDSVSNDVCDLLYWLTGDQWSLTLVPDDSTSVPPTLDMPVVDHQPVSLLSGGLDSYLGAIHLLQTVPGVRFLGHKDAAPVIRAAQTVVADWLSNAYKPAPSYTRLPFRPAGGKRERSSRSRSFLFITLGIAAAAGSGPGVLYVPENGYTSLNIPLHPNRSGALTTRSTHPVTFARIQAIAVALNLQVTINNPFGALTKGEVMSQVARQSPPPDWLSTSWKTISCSKLDGGRMPGGNPNYNCGLCVPCLVRRGTYIASGQDDGTLYLSNEMTDSDLTELVRRRRGDLNAVKYAIGAPIEEDLIDAQTWPEGYDLDEAQALAQRGLDELARVPLL